MAQIRSFLAVELPEGMRSEIGRIQERLRSSRAHVRWVSVERIHLTLKFFGNIEEEKVNEILSIMEEVGNRQKAFTLSVRGLGAFPSTKNPRVVWLGLQGWEKDLSSLHREIETRLEGLGFLPENRPFRPHLTVGRVKSLKGRADLVDLMERDRDVDLGSFTVDKLVLFRSDLRPTGPIYTPLATREFAGG